MKLKLTNAQKQKNYRLRQKLKTDLLKDLLEITNQETKTTKTPRRKK